MNRATDDILAQATGLQPISSPYWVQQRSAVSAPQELLHPCVVNQQDTLVHASDLSQRHPGFFKRLELFARQQGFTLLADRRARDTAVVSERRKPWIPAVILGLSMQPALVAAEAVVDSHDHHNHLAVSYTHHPEHTSNNTSDYETVQDADYQTRLALVVEQVDTDNLIPVVDHPELQQPTALPASSVAEPFMAVSAIDKLDSRVAEVEAILFDHFQSSASTPDHISTDISDMAKYFAQYPEAVRLIKSLQGERWQLSYRKDSFETQVTGNQIQVKSVKVFFDSRSAAQLRKHKACGDKPGACIASPADALLHELLHAEIALLNTQEFIAQGGLSRVIYPYQHEQAVIKRENQLYKSMSHLDGSYRPHRSGHSGQLLASACVTCLD